MMGTAMLSSCRPSVTLPRRQFAGEIAICRKRVVGRVLGMSSLVVGALQMHA